MPLERSEFLSQLTNGSLNFAAAGDNTIIAAPGAGNRIHIVFLEYQNVSDTTLTCIHKSGSTALNGNGWKITGNSTDGVGGSYVFEGMPGHRVMRLGINEAFVINLSAAKACVGYVIYYIAPSGE